MFLSSLPARRIGYDCDWRSLVCRAPKRENVPDGAVVALAHEELEDTLLPRVVAAWAPCLLHFITLSELCDILAGLACTAVNVGPSAILRAPE